MPHSIHLKIMSNLGLQRMKANPMMMNNPMRNQFMNTRMGGNNIQKQALNNMLESSDPHCL